MQPEPLRGGWSHPGSIYRRGGVVLRPADAFTPSRGILLRHLKTAGFEASPQYWGCDTQGLEHVEYLPGEALDSEALPAWARTQGVVEDMCRLVRRYDDLMTEYPLKGVNSWNLSLCSDESGPLVIHNDICPDNTVFRNRRPAGIIDWEYASPGSAQDDLAQALYTFVVSPEFECDPTLAAERLKQGYTAYGKDRFDWEALVAALIRRHDIRTRFRWHKVLEGDPLFVESWRSRGGTLARSARRDWLTEL